MIENIQKHLRPGVSRISKLFNLIILISFFVLSNSCSEKNTINNPNPVVEKEYYIFVGSRNTHSVKRYDGKTGEYLGDFVTAGSGGLNTTQDLLFLPDSSLIVTGLNNSVIKRYDGKTGEYINDFSSGYSLASPTKMSIGPDSLLYVSQWGSVQNKIARFRLDGSFINEFTSVGISNALDHAWDTAGNFYAASYGSGNNGKIFKFNSSGTFVETFITTGNVRGPSGIWFGKNNDFFVADWTLGKVQHFSSSGQFISTFITGMANIEGFAFTPDNKLLLCDWTRNKVFRYDESGMLIDTLITTGGLSSPNSIAIRFK